MESIEHVQVFDHHQRELLVELIGADERGSTTVQSYACKLDGDGVAHLPSDIEGEHRVLVKQALGDEGYDVLTHSPK